MEQDTPAQEIVALRQQNSLLEEKIAQLSRVEQTLNTILRGTAAQTGEDYFASLVQYLGETLQATITFIGELIGPNKDQVRTLAVWRNNGLDQNFTYTLDGTPCATVVGHGVRYYQANVAELFPEDSILRDYQIECYAGAPLLDAAQKPSGILAVMDTNPFEIGVDFVPILSIFAARAGAELARKHSLETLSKSETRYRNLVEQSNEAIFLAYKNRFEFVNDRFCQIFGLSRADILAGKLSLTAIVSPESIPFFRKRQQAWASGESVPEQFEFSAQTADGRILPVAVSVSYVAYGEGTAVQGILWDLAQRKQIEADERAQRRLAEALAQQNAHLLEAANQRADALRTTGEILRVLNSASDIRDALPDLVTTLQAATNCQHITLAQFDEDQNHVYLFNISTPPHDLENSLRLHTSEIAATHSIISGQPCLVSDISKEAQFHPVQLFPEGGVRSYIALPLQVDKITTGILTLGWTTPHGYNDTQLPFLEQISDAIALGIERSRLFAQSQTRTQELNMLNRVISAAASGLSELEITQVVCREIAGYLSVDHVSLMEVDSTFTSGLVTAQYIAPNFPSLIGQRLALSPKNPLMKKIITGGKTIRMESVAQYPLDAETRSLADAYHLVSALLVPILLRGDLLGIMSVGSTTSRLFSEEEIRLAHTISEELGRILETARLYDQLRFHAAELEERVAERTSELAEANAQLKELDELKSQFVSDVSHELRTPVTNLKLYLDLLQHRGETLLPKYLPVLQKQADRLGQLIEDILDISRLDMRRNQPLAFAPVDLNSVAQDVINAHQLRIEASGLKVNLMPCAGLPPAFAVYNQLAQVVTNLLANAIHYTPTGQINVRLSAAGNGKWVCLAVEDTGIGIHQDDIAYLFNRFYRGRQARQSNIPGTGLGLAIVQDIVQLHRGYIEVVSEEGRGSTFTVYLPTPPPESREAISPDLG